MLQASSYAERPRPPALRSSASSASSPQSSEPTTPSIAAGLLPTLEDAGKLSNMPLPVARSPSRIFHHKRSSSELSATLAANGGVIRSRQELEKMLRQAEDLISQKERELAVAASLGQSLLNDNNVLRGKHDQLAARLGVDKSPHELRFSPSVSNFVNATGSTSSVPSSASKATRAPLREVTDWNAQPSPSGSFTEAPRRRTRTRTCSTASALPSVPGSPSRGSETGLLTPSHAPPSPLATLDLRNAELAAQLEDLQQETARADRIGKQKLRKLDKEMKGLQEELAAALSHNTILQEKLGASTKIVSPLTPDESVHDYKGEEYAWPAGPKPSRSARERKFDDSAPIETSDPRSAGLSSIDGSLPFIESELSQDDAPESIIVAQLLQKIHELETTNDSIEAHREELDERLGRAQVELDGLRRSYEELEADVGRDEASKQSSQSRAITYTRQSTPQKLTASPSPSKKRGKGNRRIIEKRRSQLGLAMSRQSSMAALRHASSRASFRTGSRPGLKHKASSASMFFGDDSEAAAADDEDVLDAMKREDAERQRLYSTTDMGTGSAGSTPVKERGKTLGSELGSLWGSPEASRAIDVPGHQRYVTQGSTDDEDYGQAQLRPPTFSGLPGQSPPRPDHRLHIAAAGDYDYEGDDPFTTKDDIIPLGGLRDSQRPDEDAYDMLDRRASEMPVAWEDTGKARVGWNQGPTYQGGFAFEDTSDGEGAGNDPWGEQGALQIENAELIKERERADRRHERRQARLRRVAESETGSNAASELNGYAASTASRRSRALRRLGFSSPDSEDDEEEPEEFEHLRTADYARRRRGTDYWPVALRARYAPGMIVNRLRTEVALYIDFVVTWAHVLAVIALAVVFAVSKGPAAVLGDSGRHRRLR